MLLRWNRCIIAAFTSVAFAPEVNTSRLQLKKKEPLLLQQSPALSRVFWPRFSQMKVWPVETVKTPPANHAAFLFNTIARCNFVFSCGTARCSGELFSLLMCLAVCLFFDRTIKVHVFQLWGRWAWSKNPTLPPLPPPPLSLAAEEKTPVLCDDRPLVYSCSWKRLPGQFYEKGRLLPLWLLNTLIKGIITALPTTLIFSIKCWWADAAARFGLTLRWMTVCPRWAIYPI